LAVEGQQAHGLRVVARHLDVERRPAPRHAAAGRVERSGQFLAEALDARNFGSQLGQHLEAHPTGRHRAAGHLRRHLVQCQHGLDSVSLKLQFLAHGLLTCFLAK
jgi:hypothetical protein